jgi:hypothetical protein
VAALGGEPPEPELQLRDERVQNKRRPPLQVFVQQSRRVRAEPVGDEDRGATQTVPVYEAVDERCGWYRFTG